jgi:hypothetical protein
MSTVASAPDQSSARPKIATTQNVIAVTVYPLLGVNYFLGLLLTLLIAVVAPFIVISHHFDWGDILVGSFALLLAIFQLTILSRLPLKYELDNDNLTTYGLRGKKTIRLSSISSIKEVAITGGRGGNKFCLKCEDATGNAVFLQLGSLARAKRMLFYEPLKPIVESHYGLDGLWERWFSFLEH